MSSMKNSYTVPPGAVFKVVWKVTCLECREFTGRYKGLSAVASETAMVFDVDGMLRFIKDSSVICMDQIEAAPEEESSKKTDSGSVFYG